MSYELTVQQKVGYLHIKVMGDNSPQTVRGYLADAYVACVQRHCSSLLIEEELRGPGLSVLDIYQIVSEGSQRTWPHVRRIAYVDVNKEHSSANLHFAETVATNRRVNVRLFSTVEEAEEWLRAATTMTEG
jgi:hypothetical protein